MRKTKKKRFDPLFDFFRHPLLLFGHLTFVRLAAALAVLSWMAGAAFVSQPAGAAQSSSHSHAHDFVIFATVFTDQGFALTGARVRVRRVGEKKFKWEGASDHRGEVAFRVPQNEEYELAVEARGFQTETRKIDAREDVRADLTIRLQRQGKELSGGKP